LPIKSKTTKHSFYINIYIHFITIFKICICEVEFHKKNIKNVTETFFYCFMSICKLWVFLGGPFFF
jgi:hypothetical protein